jgi:hypothetical protein
MKTNNTKACIFLLIFLLIIVFSSCKHEKIIDSRFATLILECDEEDEHLVSVKFHNVQNRNVRLCLSGEIRWKNYLSSASDSIFYDTILEIKTMGKVLRSDSLVKDEMTLFNHTFSNIILNPDSSVIIPLYYGGNLIKDFNLKNNNAMVRAVIKTISSDNLTYFHDCSGNDSGYYLDTVIYTNYVSID